MATITNKINGTTDNDDLNGTQYNDIFHMGGGGSDTVHGRDGDDIFLFGGTLDQTDRVYGGPGDDIVVLNHAHDVHIGAHTLNGIEAVFLSPGADYSLTFADNPGATGEMQIFAETGPNQSAHVDASAESNLHFFFGGGDGNDYFAGGQRADIFIGNGGADIFVPGAGEDFFLYKGADSSTGLRFDTVQGFDVDHDSFGVGSVSAIDDPVIGGVLDSHHPKPFNHSLEAAIGADQLAVDDAVIFQPDAGDWAGHTFLIVDENGHAGYQGHQDLVVELTGNHLTDFSLANVGGPA